MIITGKSGVIRPTGSGRRSTVARAVLDSGYPLDVGILRQLSHANRWHEARGPLARLGEAGRLIDQPEKVGGLTLPPSKGEVQAHWGLPDVVGVALLLLQV